MNLTEGLAKPPPPPGPPGAVPCVFTDVDLHAKWLHKVARHTMVGLYASTTATKQLEITTGFHGRA